MRKTKKNYAVAALTCLVLLTAAACSKDENPTPKGTHIVWVKPMSLGILRLTDIKIFISEQPFESPETFKPLASVDRPSDMTLIDSMAIDVSAYVGKTLYFTAMRTYLLTDGYHSVTLDSETQDPADLKLTIEQDIPEYRLAFVMSDPERGAYPTDKATVTLTAKKGSAVATGKEIFQFRLPSYVWTEEYKQSLEDTYRNTGVLLSADLIGKTDAQGRISVELPVDEVDEVNNTYFFFVLDDDGRIQPVEVTLTSLAIAATLTY